MQIHYYIITKYQCHIMWTVNMSWVELNVVLAWPWFKSFIPRTINYQIVMAVILMGLSVVAIAALHCKLEQELMIQMGWVFAVSTGGVPFKPSNVMWCVYSNWKLMLCKGFKIPQHNIWTKWITFNINSQEQPQTRTLQICNSLPLQEPRTRTTLHQPHHWQMVLVCDAIDFAISKYMYLKQDQMSSIQLHLQHKRWLYHFPPIQPLERYSLINFQVLRNLS